MHRFEEESSVRILLIDNHVLFREGLRHILQQLPGGVDEILETESFADGLKLAGQHPGPDMVLLELESPGSDGVLSVRFFHQRFPHIPLVVVSSEKNDRVIRKALAYGARGFVCKSSAGAVLLDAVNRALSESIYAKAQSLRQFSRMASHQNSRNEYGLTLRQMDILKHLAAGLSNKAIAVETDLADSTVKAHVAAVCKILRGKNRMDAVLIARRLGLVGMPDGADSAAHRGLQESQ